MKASTLYIPHKHECNWDDYVVEEELDSVDSENGHEVSARVHQQELEVARQKFLKCGLL